MRVRLVATDLDGTLLRGDGTISAFSGTTLRRARAAGIPHVIVTGRPAAGCMPYFRELGYRGMAVCGQGAEIYDADAGTLTSSLTLSRAEAEHVAKSVLAASGTAELAVVTAGLDGSYLRLADAAAVPGDVTKVLVSDPGLPVGALAALVAEICDGSLSVVQSDRGLVEVLPWGVDKAVGLAKVAGALGVADADVLAFGDMPNDKTMILRAGHGVAMSNAHPELRAVADEIAPSNDDDGVAVVLGRLLARMNR